MSEISMLWNRYKEGDYDPPRGVEADSGNETVETERAEEEIEVLEAAEALVEEIVETYEVSEEGEVIEEELPNDLTIEEEVHAQMKIAEMVDEEHPDLLNEVQKLADKGKELNKKTEKLMKTIKEQGINQSVKVLQLFRMI